MTYSRCEHGGTFGTLWGKNVFAALNCPAIHTGVGRFIRAYGETVNVGIANRLIRRVWRGILDTWIKNGWIENYSIGGDVLVKNVATQVGAEYSYKRCVNRSSTSQDGFTT